jgi:branched-chain amino acid transport system substrate-binding protein
MHGFLRLLVGCTACLSFAQLAAAQEPLKIGVLGDMSGMYEAMSGKGSVVAAQMAIDDMGGSVLGRKVEVVTGDSQNKPDIASGLAKRWFENENVMMITDNWGSSVGLAVQVEARRVNRIALFSGAGTADLSGKECSPTGFVWTFDTTTLARAIATTLVKQGLDTWYFLTPDFVFGHQAEETATQIVTSLGGKVLGSSKFPLTNVDFSSFLITAQASKAKVIVMTGGDIASAMKQAAEFGILAGGQKFATIVLYLPYARAIGPKLGEGLYVTNSFYWDLNEQTRAWSQRYFEKVGAEPTMNHAGTYSSTLHYLQAVQKAGTVDTDAVVAAMRAAPVSDATAHGTLRSDGRLVRDYYMWQMKGPSESKSEWDLLKPVKHIPAEEIVPSLAESGCPLAMK